ncbi:hypothetical protein AYO21_03864 [Fonsecaea monophora]|uniref:NmrA-like domain-containing protein n=1 Tax=Fonsecaea monophora TaxID=254056 RepID=A0A177FDR1_9EURO|nr:hypothetical protein AYO21_03864 [Fonsecaea monophora]OAG41861.1 hypothetical protein AYO21_03864 [Fonsecaea monophora]
MATQQQGQGQGQLQLPARTKSILVLGAGELGLAILDAILAHPAFEPGTSRVTLLVRPNSLNNPSPAQRSQQALLRSRGVDIIAGDIEASSQSKLAELFAPFTAVLHAGGMTLPPGTMTKVTHAVLEAQVPYYIPWQHGVDYDIIGREGGQGMFSEQIDVRELLRGQHDGRKTDWVIVSCGIFMSFLFEDSWGVVRRIPSTGKETTRDKIQITALNSWDDVITATTAEDIGKCTAALLFTPDAPTNTPVYIAGDTLTYGAFADTVEQVVAPLGMEVVRQVWPLSYLRKESESDPEDKLKRYRVVFSEGKGLSWPKERTWSAKQGIPMVTVAEYAKRLFSAEGGPSQT